ncbi:lipoyl amidotransferase LIPT1, mitochondrial-like isoform X2 [Ptychodera flava]
MNFEDVYLLFLWRNSPCVVIGRHQNPWVECNIPKLQENNVRLARRKSGGGTVYHDLGNINITFFTPRKKYDRHLNLELIMRALKSHWPEVDVSLSPRDDLMLNKDYKISGSAAKLGRSNAYHHCTLLFNVDASTLSEMLHSQTDGIDSKATESVRSKVMNLSQVDPSISYESLSQAISEEFYELYPASHDRKIYEFCPTDEEHYSGITQLRSQLMQWKWLYGSTPKFSVSRDFGSVSVCLHTKNGHVEDVTITGEMEWLTGDVVEKIGHSVKGIRYWHNDLVRALSHLKSTQSGSEHLHSFIDGICDMTGDHH